MKKKFLIYKVIFLHKIINKLDYLLLYKYFKIFKEYFKKIIFIINKIYKNKINIQFKIKK